jgi:hypothetical protein
MAPGRAAETAEAAGRCRVCNAGHRARACGASLPPPELEERIGPTLCMLQRLQHLSAFGRGLFQPFPADAYRAARLEAGIFSYP